MSREDYNIDGVNISSLAREAKKFYGACNITKAIKILDHNKIQYKLVTGGIKFNIDGVKFTFWGKKNRVYDGIVNTNLSMIKFIKQNKDIILKGNNECYFQSSIYILKFGKYQGYSINELKKTEEGYQYIKWLLESDILYEVDRKKVNDIFYNM